MKEKIHCASGERHGFSGVRILSMLLLLCMLLTMLPLTALAASDVTLRCGESYQLEGKGTGTFVSSNPGIAQVTQEGKITAMGEGQTNIGLYLSGGGVVTWNITVTPGDTPQETKKFQLDMKVGDKKQIEGASFISTNTSVVTVTNAGLITALKAGKAAVYVYEGPVVAASYTITVTSDVPEVTEPDDSVWPFVPSKKNTKNGYIHSGWYEIMSHDLGKLRILDSGVVVPSRRAQAAFYIEHLGNNRYYIYDYLGRYLSYDKLKRDGDIIVSKNPTKWRIDLNAKELWKRAYEFRPVSNQNLIIGARQKKCSDTEDSYIRFQESTLGTGSGAWVTKYMLFTVEDRGLEHYIPQWYKDYQAGLSKPSDVSKPDYEEEYGYYDKKGFAEETTLPVITTSVNYNTELIEFEDDFPKWASPASDVLLSKNERGTYLSADVDDTYVVITKTAANGSKLGSQYIKKELPIFGAIYSGATYNYIAFGQENSESNASKESIRIVKYDKEWNKISSVSINARQTNAVKPFSASSARFAENGNTLILYTSRLRFKGSDGVRHQSNLEVRVNTSSMKATYVSPAFPSNHVSHSFDQYIRFDGSKPVYLDHGDAYPRSVVLQTSAGKATMFAMSGGKGVNYTGVTVGGLEVSNSSYLTVLATIDQNAAQWSSSDNGAEPDNENSLNRRDIVACVVPRNFGNGATAKTITLGRYIGTSTIGTTPQLLKISNDKFAVLWGEFSTTKPRYELDDDGEEDSDSRIPNQYVVQYIDGQGNPIGAKKTYSTVKSFYKEYQAAAENTTTPPQPEKPNTPTKATPTNTKFMLRNSEVVLPAYLIDSSNYVKLRDVAALLKTRFEVRWEDNQAKLFNHTTYSAIGGELVPTGTASTIATPSTTNFVWGETGKAVSGLTAYTIADSNYIKLRDIAKLFDFDVDWKDNKAWLEPDTTYTDD